jgi:hypothetical protein
MPFDLENFIDYVHRNPEQSGEVAVALVTEIDDLRTAVTALRTVVEAIGTLDCERDWRQVCPEG